MKPLYRIAFLTFCISVNYTIGQEASCTLNDLLDQYQATPLTPIKEVEINNVATINTPYVDYCPVYHKKGIVFSSCRPKKEGPIRHLFFNGNSNLFFTTADEEDRFFKPISLPGKINTLRHEGSAAFNPAGNEMIYTTNCRRPGKEGLYELKLRSAQFDGASWTNHQDLPFNQDYRSCHPTISADGKTLVFASLRPDGLGGMDLYASEWVEGQWTTPVNLGPHVNTSGDEVFPHLDPDNQLYFSSNGHPGLGKLDIYVSVQDENCIWQPVQRLNEPFNSRWDDFGLIVKEDAREGFFSSDRPGGKGLDDIYAWSVQEVAPTPDQELAQLSVVDQLTGLSLMNSEITVVEINPYLLRSGYIDEPLTIDNELSLPVFKLLGTIINPIQRTEAGDLYPISTDRNYLMIVKINDQVIHQQLMGAGQLGVNDHYAIEIPTNPSGQPVVTHDDMVALPPAPVEEWVIGGIAMLDSTLAKKSIPATFSPVVVEKPPVAPDKEVFASRGITTDLLSDTPNMEAVELPEANTVVAFNAIYHPYSRVDISEDSQYIISEIVNNMNTDKTLRLTIVSHTDSRGGAVFNQKLSLLRAIAVRQLLIDRGIAPSRLLAQGKGESELLNHCADGVDCVEAEHQVNRRTEFLVGR